MADLNQIRSNIEQNVSRRLGGQLEQLQREVVEQVLREIEPLLASGGQEKSAAPSQNASAASGMLSAAVTSIQESTVQADILKALLEGVSGFSARSALFVVRGSTLAGWQARGFSDENIRGLSLDGSKGLASRAIQHRGRASAAATEFDFSFIERQGNPWDGNATVFPLVVKDKVAAILYCDSGREAGTQTDYSAVEVLTRFTCLWLEHSAVRKHLGSSGAEAAASAVPIPAASAPPAPPAAAHAPVSQSSATKAATASEPVIDNLPAEEQELHKKAKRFAKLLVDEIKLYNQSKVAEGKQNHDLYRVLREDIEKSRATYDKRYGSTPVASAKYFDSEIVRVLADNDRALLGSDFPG
jgi:hypothetical protein